MLQCRCVELRASRERLSGPSSALVFRGLLWTFAAAVLGLVLMIGRRGLERVPNPGQAAAAAPMKSTCRDAGARPSTSPAGTPPRPRRCLERTRGSQRDVSHAKTTHKTRRTARVGAVSPQWSTTTSGKIRKLSVHSCSSPLPRRQTLQLSSLDAAFFAEVPQRTITAAFSHNRGTRRYYFAPSLSTAGFTCCSRRRRRLKSR